MRFITVSFSLVAFLLIVVYIIYNEGKPPATGGFVHIEDEYNPPLGAYPQHYNAESLNIPESLAFAGEEVPLHIPDVKERLDRELHVNTYWHNNTIFLMKRAHRWLPLIEKVLKENGIPEDFKYLPVIEAGLVNAVSPKKAVGFWQILKPAGKENGLEITKEVDERYDPLKASEAACKYLKKAFKKFGNWTSVAASYNRGVAGLQRAMDDQEVDSYYDLLLNQETSRYVFRILAIKEIIENPEKYGFSIDQKHLYSSEKLKIVEVKTSIPDLVHFANDQGINYKLLKRHNPWLRGKKLSVKKGKSYKIAVPLDI